MDALCDGVNGRIYGLWVYTWWITLLLWGYVLTAVFAPIRHFAYLVFLILKFPGFLERMSVHMAMP